MFQPFKSLLVASLLLGVALTSTVAAEREDVRKAINLVTSVKMPFPESLSRNRARTERVWLEREGATTGCIRLEDRRWCYEGHDRVHQARGSPVVLRPHCTQGQPGGDAPHPQ